MTERVRITDVSPRDGLQNEAGIVPTASKVRLIELLGATGVDEVEITSFVSPKWVPQLGDAAEVCRGLRPPRSGRDGVVYSALVPNERGLQGALEANRAAGGALLRKVSVFTAASEEFSKRNTNASIAETIERFVPVVRGAHAAGLAVRGYVSCVVACPFAGAVEPGRVAEVSARLREIGVDELDLGDTIGAATPESTRAVLRAVRAAWPEFAPTDATPSGKGLLTLHLHDTFGRSAACVRAAIDEGVRSFDGSVAGLGGCPYAGTPGKPAPGNVSTELLVRTVREAGLETGVDDARLAEAAAYARGIVAGAR